MNDLTRAQAILVANNAKRKDRTVLVRCGLPVMVKKVKEYIYFQDPEKAKYSKSENVEIDGYYSELNGFTFEKAGARWYWCVYGKMPMEIAEKLFADPCGRTDIRVAGHCGCPPPSEAPWFSWITKDDKTVISTKDYNDWVRQAEHIPELNGSLEKYVASDEPERIASAFVKSYHIDSELGLHIFVDAVKALRS